MGQHFAQTMFGAAARHLQEQGGSGAHYERMARAGAEDSRLGPHESEFIRRRDSFYMASITPSGWPYVQHRGGPIGFLRVLDPKTLAFADFDGNRQYISAGNLSTNDRVSLFLMDYPNQTRLKLIGQARTLGSEAEETLRRAVQLPGYRGKIERIVVIAIAGFDWNCPQHIEPRYTAEEMRAMGCDPAAM